MIEFLNLKKQYIGIQTEIDKAIKDVIMNSAFIGGKFVKAFEEQFADYQQSGHCIGCGNGRK